MDHSNVVWLRAITEGTRNMGKSCRYSFCISVFYIYLPLCPALRDNGSVLHRYMGSDKIEESAQIKDPGFIVVDEVVGQWMALLPLPFLYTIIDNNSFYLYSVPIAVAGFLVFRLFDIWKPWPVNYADKNIPGGYGIMFDDVIAGMYALIVTSVLTAVMVMICL